MVALSPIATSAAADAALQLLDGGALRLYAAAQPLAELRFGVPAFAPAVDGRATAAPLIPGRAVADGTADSFRAFAPDGTTEILRGSVGKAPSDRADLLLNSVMLTVGTIVSLSSFIYTQRRTP